jgi:hypothetical protein
MTGETAARDQPRALPRRLLRALPRDGGTGLTAYPTSPATAYLTERRRHGINRVPYLAGYCVPYRETAARDQPRTLPRRLLRALPRDGGTIGKVLHIHHGSERIDHAIISINLRENR